MSAGPTLYEWMMECCGPSDDDHIQTSEIGKQIASAGPPFCTWMPSVVVMSPYVHMVIYYLCPDYCPCRLEFCGPSEDDLCHIPELWTQSTSARPTLCAWMTSVDKMSQYVHMVIYCCAQTTFHFTRSAAALPTMAFAIVLNYGGRVRRLGRRSAHGCLQ